MRFYVARTPPGVISGASEPSLKGIEEVPYDMGGADRSAKAEKTGTSTGKQNERA